MFLSTEDFRNKMEVELEKTLHQKSVQVSGHTLQEALKEASTELSLPLKSLNYEVLERGRGGLLGLKAVPCRIIAYEATKQKNKDPLIEELESTFDVDDVPINTQMDGRFTLRFTAVDQVMLKVFPPVKNGTPVAKDTVLAELEKYDISGLNTDFIHTAIERADAMWIKIGTYEHRPDNDFDIIVTIANNDMHAYITVQEPGYNGATVSVKDINSALELRGVQEGIIQEALQNFEDFPVYNTEVLVAKGMEAVDGSDAEIKLEFQTDVKPALKERADGSVDFKEINRIQNVQKGQVVARKLPPKYGQNGRTIFGTIVIAKDGKDKEFNIGDNVELTKDGDSAIATVNGHVLLKGGKICVDKVLLIPGNVDIRIGNIDALGSVDIRGNVEDGLSVKAEGNIHVAGYVGKANLEAGENIIVARGINGGESNEYGYIAAGKNIWASFIQNAEARAGDFVIVSSGIVNAKILAEKKVLCQGRRARIVGGDIQAAEEVNAVILGTSSGTKTRIAVGFNPRVKEKLNQLTAEYKDLNSRVIPLQMKLKKYTRQLKLKKSKMTKEGKQYFQEIHDKYQEIADRMKTLDDEINEWQKYQDSLRVQGRVSASSMVHAGVTIHINDIEYVIKQSYTYPVSFVLKDNFVQLINYMDIEDDIEIRSENEP